MKLLLAAFSLFFVSPLAQASVSRALEPGFQLIQTEYAAIRSGRYTMYRPETIRSILTNLNQTVAKANAQAATAQSRQALSDLSASIREEYNYSFRFKFYRLASTELLLVNYERLMNLAIDADQEGNGSFGDSHFDCNGPHRVACLN